MMDKKVFRGGYLCSQTVEGIVGLEAVGAVVKADSSLTAVEVEASMPTALASRS